GGAILMMYRRSLRNRFLGWCDRCSSRVLDTLGKRESHGRRVSRVLVHVNEGMEFLASQPLGMVVPIFWIFLDWLLTLGILYAAFFSVGYPVSVSQVAVGFSVSLVVAIMSLVPAGVGVLEATMAATFLTVGVPLKVSVLPIVIFRICYYVIPVIMALVLAPRAFADAEGSVGELMT
ncbi:MAG: YbhN family protein, partial [Candidatus Binatia bacterium]